MTISQVYEKFSTPRNLQEHQLRVAALAKIIMDSWAAEPLDTHAVIVACTLHDIAKPVNFNIEKQIEFGASATEIYSLENLQKLIKTKYGTDEHKASVEMCRDVGAGDIVCGILDKIEWSYIPSLLSKKNFEALLSIYCDMRIGPFGILSFTERINNLKERRDSEDWTIYFKLGEELENILKEKTSVDLNSPTDSDLSSLFEELLKIEI